MAAPATAATDAAASKGNSAAKGPQYKPFVMPPDEASKAKQVGEDHMLKTANTRRVFNLTETESVVQNYTCSLKGSFVGGRMYITQNYLCYQEKLPARIEKIPFRKITAINEEYVLFFWYISIETADGKFLFGSFNPGHGAEAFAILKYLWQNPPSYIDIVKIEADEEEEKVKRQKAEMAKKNLSTAYNPFGGVSVAGNWADDKSATGSVTSSNPFGPGPVAPASSTAYNPFGGGTNASPQVQTFQRETAKVDVEASREALRLVQESMKLGTNTLQELAIQAEKIDSIENTIEGIHAKIDKSEYLLRGIESLPAYIGQSLKKQKERRVKLIKEDRTVRMVKGKDPTMDIEILCKKADDSMWEAILVFGAYGITCIDPNTDQLLEPFYSYKYEEIAAVIMRSRPEHADLRFFNETGKERFRFMSSYLQIIANEIILRTKKDQVQILFEHGSHKFEFGRARISVQPPVNRDTGATGGFFRKENQIKTSSLLSENASEETRQALNEVDKNLGDIFDTLGGLGQVSATMGREIDRQNEQMTRINTRADDAFARVQNTNTRMDKIIKDNS